MKLLLCRGAGWISQRIAANSPSSIAEDARISHVACYGIDRCGGLKIVESHFSTNGVIAYSSFKDWRENNKRSKVWECDYPRAKINDMLIYARLKVPYGMSEILANRNDIWANLLPDSPGVICSELIAENDDGYIQDWLKGQYGKYYPDHLIKPVHFQEWAYSNPQSNLREFNL